jgi:hypothetical protein
MACETFKPSGALGCVAASQCMNISTFVQKRRSTKVLRQANHSQRGSACSDTGSVTEGSTEQDRAAKV